MTDAQVRNDVRPQIRDLVPKRMLRRPIDHRGYPVPWFVTTKDDQGRWEFRVVEQERQHQAIQERRCWICGERLGRYVSFAVGPMCGINRTSGEPPQHRECAEFAVKACPFMLLPRAKRRGAQLPSRAKFHPQGLRRNSGVVLIWTTRSFRIISAHGFLWRMGEPESVSFWSEGREATRAEIDESVAGGLPALQEMATMEGPDAAAELKRMIGVFERLLPEAA